MGIGGSIFLIVVGAILTWGLKNQDLGPLNLDTIGWILMAAGLFGLILTLWVWNSRRTRVTTTQREVQAPPYVDNGGYPPPPAPGGRVVHEQRYTERQDGY
jgi:hypothetical protein